MRSLPRPAHPETYVLKRIPILLALLALLALGACCCGVTDPGAPPPVHAVRLDSWYYLLAEDRAADAPGGPVLGPEYARVLRRVECDGVIHTGNGQIQDPCGLEDGDSDLLPAGTTLHPVDGIPGGQRVGAVLDGRVLIFAIRFPPD
jgi:hypothetical protein